jgi:hypothetical protein
MGSSSMIGAARTYSELIVELFLARLGAGGALSQAEEARFAGALDRCWHAMSEAEQDEIESELASKNVPQVSEEPNQEDREVVTGSTGLPRAKRAA